MSVSGKGKRSGFTLIELATALAISGLVLLMVGMSLRLGVRSWEKGNEQARSYQRLRAIGHGLGSELSSAVLPRTSTLSRVAFEAILASAQRHVGESEDVRVFVGRADSIAFVTPLVILAGKPAPGLYRLEYYVRKEEDGEPGLVCAIGPYLGPGYVPAESETREVLVDPDVTRIELSYLNPSKQEEGAIAVEQPPAEDEEITEPPELVNIKLSRKLGPRGLVEEFELAIALGTGYGMLVEEAT